MNATGGFRIEGLSCGYPPASFPRRGGRTVLSGFSADQGPGAVVGIIGPNGAGKSTLISTLSGFLPPLEGSIRLDGLPLGRIPPRERARRIALVLTESEKPAWALAREIVALGRQPHTNLLGSLGEGDRAAVERALRDAGAAHLADRRFAELSDGERQRVLIARAFAQESPILIMDEPEIFLDLPSKRDLLGLLSEQAHREGKLVLVSLHDIDLAVERCDRLWLLEKEEGAPARVLSGLPEDLSLSGAISRAFKAPTAPPPGLPPLGDGGFLSPLDLLFPPEPAASRLWYEVEGGTATQRFWTGRLLRRLGYSAGGGEEDQQGSILISGTATAAAWTLSSARGRFSFSSLEALASVVTPGLNPIDLV